MIYPLYIGCAAARHKKIGVNAVVNARAGLQHLNDFTLDDLELRRDAQRIKDRVTKRHRFYQFNSKFCRRNIARLEHLLSSYDD